MKVLLSAFACAPDKGSEPEVGYQALRAAAAEHDVWVLTQPDMVEDTLADLAQYPVAGSVTMIPVEPGRPQPKPSGMRGWAIVHHRHDQWQRNAARVAAELDATIDFDVVHHVTLAAHWTRAGVAAVDKPLVWGPVGGGVTTPRTLLGELGTRGLAEDAVRITVRWAAARAPMARQVRRRAVVTFAQNPATAELLTPAGEVRVLSNGTSVDLARVPRVGERGRDVVVVSRLIPWKAVPLGVRAFAMTTSPGAKLRVYGSGPGRAAVSAAAHRHGVADRVELVGAIPRPRLLAELSRAGVLLHPSLHDEGGTVIAETLSLGTPVVCLDHGGPAELTRQWPDVPSVRVAPGGPRATAAGLARAIDAMLATPPPVPDQPLAPRQSFAGSLRDAYLEAVRSDR